MKKELPAELKTLIALHQEVYLENIENREREYRVNVTRVIKNIVNFTIGYNDRDRRSHMHEIFDIKVLKQDDWWYEVNINQLRNYAGETERFVTLYLEELKKNIEEEDCLLTINYAKEIEGFVTIDYSRNIKEFPFKLDEQNELKLYLDEKTKMFYLNPNNIEYYNNLINMANALQISHQEINAKNDEYLFKDVKYSVMKNMVSVDYFFYRFGVLYEARFSNKKHQGELVNEVTITNKNSTADKKEEITFEIQKEFNLTHGVEQLIEEYAINRLIYRELTMVNYAELMILLLNKADKKKITQMTIADNVNKEVFDTFLLEANKVIEAENEINKIVHKIMSNEGNFKVRKLTEKSLKSNCIYGVSEDNKLEGEANLIMLEVFGQEICCALNRVYGALNLIAFEYGEDAFEKMLIKMI